MIRSGLGLVFCALLAGGPALATEFDDGKLIPRGASASGGAGVSFGEMLSRLAGAADPEPVEVQYTLDWLDSQPAPTGGDEFRCLAEALYFEARGETVRGQFAVAEVIMNRAEHSLFPDTVCGVVSQGTGRRYQCQFTYKCDGHEETIAEKLAYERVSKVARAVLDGHRDNLTDGAMYYHTNAVRPAWSKRFIRTAEIGVHYFYRRHDQRASNE